MSEANHSERDRIKYELDQLKAQEAAWKTAMENSRSQQKSLKERLKSMEDDREEKDEQPAKDDSHQKHLDEGVEVSKRGVHDLFKPHHDEVLDKMKETMKEEREKKDEPKDAKERVKGDAKDNKAGPHAALGCDYDPKKDSKDKTK